MSSVCQILVSPVARRLALAAGVVATLAACGQRGPLFLPADPAAANRATLPETIRPATGTANPVRTP